MRRITVKLTPMLLVGSTLLGLGPPRGTAPARADAVSYSAQRRIINACVLVSNATADYDNNANGGPNNPVPHLFYALDGNRAISRPDGRSSTRSRLPISHRRSSVAGAIEAAPRPCVQLQPRPRPRSSRPERPLNKNIGAYWEVNLDTVSDSDLERFDISSCPCRAVGPQAWRREQRQNRDVRR